MVLVAGCGSGNFSAPRNLDDACAIVRERPVYLKAMQRSERRWRVPVPVQMATIYQESKFVGNARTPHQFVLGVIPMGRLSSAYGYSQALDATWAEYQQATGNRNAVGHDSCKHALGFVQLLEAQVRFGQEAPRVQIGWGSLQVALERSDALLERATQPP
jgi:hypothetical protein